MNEPKKFTKKPVEIDAMQYAGTVADLLAVYQWIEKNTLGSFDINALPMSAPSSGVSIDAGTGRMVIATLEGVMWVSIGDYVIRGIKGEFYPCKPDIFAKSYQAVDGPHSEKCLVFKKHEHGKGCARDWPT